MSKRQSRQNADLAELEEILQVLGDAGASNRSSTSWRSLLTQVMLAAQGADTKLFATDLLFALGPTAASKSAIRRVLSLEPNYRRHLLKLLCEAIATLTDDQSLGETLEQLDHLSPELLQLVRSSSTPVASNVDFAAWDAAVWQAPDAITLLSKVVEAPGDVASVPGGPGVVVGFDWLKWETPPANPAPAPWGSSKPLDTPLTAARHPFWGAMIATLDACTGDYEWQSLILRGGILRSQHRSLGEASAVLDTIWRRELGLYPAAPLIVPDLMSFTPRGTLPWLPFALERLSAADVAVEVDGSWRLTDKFRTQLMKNDEHMLAFEAVRRRSYRLARAAEVFAGTQSEVAAL